MCPVIGNITASLSTTSLMPVQDRCEAFQASEEFGGVWLPGSAGEAVKEGYSGELFTAVQ